MDERQPNSPSDTEPAERSRANVNVEEPGTISNRPRDEERHEDVPAPGERKTPQDHA